MERFINVVYKVDNMDTEIKIENIIKLNLEKLPKDVTPVSAVIPTNEVNLDYLRKHFEKEDISFRNKTDLERKLSELVGKMKVTCKYYFDVDIASKLVMNLTKLDYFSNSFTVYYYKKKDYLLFLVSEPNTIILAPRVGEEV